MKGKFLSWITGIILIFAVQDRVVGQAENLDYAREQARILKKGTLVFRLPVNGPKIRFYKNKLKETQDPAKQNEIREALDLAEKLNRQKFEALRNAIEKEYTFSDYVIIPDSNYLAFEKGNRNIFYNRDGVIDPAVAPEKDIRFLMIAGANEDQWTLVDTDLRPIGKPFPYRSTIFLAGLTRVFNRQRYYEKQMRWFNQKLKAF